MASSLDKEAQGFTKVEKKAVIFPRAYKPKVTFLESIQTGHLQNYVYTVTNESKVVISVVWWTEKSDFAMKKVFVFDNL